MVTSSAGINSLAEIYQEHIWIDTDLDDSMLSLSEAEISQICISAVREHLTKCLNLVTKSVFPSEGIYLPFTTGIVNGFVLSVSGVRIAFIPSQQLDLMSFEVQREWVDLSNWAADYYVPIQVDLESNYLHLWGFISREYLLERSTLDRNFQSYEVAGSDLIDDLDSLWVACDLVANKMLAPERGEILPLAALEEPELERSLTRLQQHRSVFSPRLVLPFEQWGAILDRSEHLTIYANPRSSTVMISNWFRSKVKAIENIGDTLIDGGWIEEVAKIFDRNEPLPGYYATPKIGVRGTSPTTQAEINRTVNNLYASQSSAQKVTLPTHIDSPSRLLIYLVQHTNDETLRWKAVEYLWTIEPANTKHWHRQIKDLGLVIQGHKLGLMVAAIPLQGGRYAVLTRVYSIGVEHCLPPHVKLNLLSEEGEQIYQAESRSIVMDDYIQVYFTAGIGDRFNICVSMDDASITESFAI
jgi:Protein of unknown function (DUF1822)